MKTTMLLGSLILLAAIALAPPAVADLPFEIQLSDLDGDTDIDGADLAAAIDSCTPKSYNGGGCTIELPRAVIPLNETLVLGLGANYQTGVILRGQGACGRASNPPGTSKGTILRWDGPDQGAMIEIRRAYRMRFENLCLVMDPDVTAGGPAAKYGLYFPGDNQAGLTTQGMVFQNIAIWGPVGTPPEDMTAIYITGAGTPKSAQNDKMLFENVFVKGVDVGVHQDALQALLNVYENGSLSGYSSALRVSGGNFDLKDTIVDCTKPDCVVIDLYRQPAAGAQETLFSNLYWETLDTPKTFLKIADGWSPTNSNFSNHFPVIVENSYFTNQRSGNPGECHQKLLDAATSATVSFRGNHFNSGSDIDCGFHLQASNSDLQALNTIEWSENKIRRNAPSDFVTIELTGPSIDILALTIDPATGHTFNDRNLNRQRDGGEQLAEPGTDSDQYGPALWAVDGISGSDACANLGLTCVDATEIEHPVQNVGCAPSTRRRVVFCK